MHSMVWGSAANVMYNAAVIVIYRLDLKRSIHNIIIIP